MYLDSQTFRQNITVMNYDKGSLIFVRRVWWITMPIKWLNKREVFRFLQDRPTRARHEEEDNLSRLANARYYSNNFFFMRLFLVIVLIVFASHFFCANAYIHTRVHLHKVLLMNDCSNSSVPRPLYEELLVINDRRFNATRLL